MHLRHCTRDCSIEMARARQYLFWNSSKQGPSSEVSIMFHEHGPALEDSPNPLLKSRGCDRIPDIRCGGSTGAFPWAENSPLEIPFELPRARTLTSKAPVQRRRGINAHDGSRDLCLPLFLFRVSKGATFRRNKKGYRASKHASKNKRNVLRETDTP